MTRGVVRAVKFRVILAGAFALLGWMGAILSHWDHSGGAVWVGLTLSCMATMICSHIGFTFAPDLPLIQRDRTLETWKARRTLKCLSQLSAIPHGGLCFAAVLALFLGGPAIWASTKIGHPLVIALAWASTLISVCASYVLTDDLSVVHQQGAWLGAREPSYHQRMKRRKHLRLIPGGKSDGKEAK